MDKDSIVLPRANTQLAEHLKQLNNGRPLIGPGSGRGRKKAKVLKLLQQEAEMKGELKGACLGLLLEVMLNHTILLMI